MRELAHSSWAVSSEVLPLIASFLRGESSADALRETTEAASDGPASHGGVAVIPLRGLITPRGTLLGMLFGGGGGLQQFRSELRRAVASDEVGSILLNVDSPGGRVDLLTETAADIRDAREAKPVVAIANTMAASAAYWLASQATEVVVTPSGRVGSIGVLAIHEDVSKMDEQLGIKTTLIAAGKYKTEGNPYEPLSDEAREAFQGRIDEAYSAFISDVALGRGTTPKAVRADFGEGRMVGAKDAVKQKMADRVDTVEGALTRLASRPGATGAKSLQLQEHITTVLTAVDGLIDRAADVVTLRAEQGKGLGGDSQELLTGLDNRLERLREVLTSEPDDKHDAADVAQEYLRHAVAARKEDDEREAQGASREGRS